MKVKLKALSLGGFAAEGRGGGSEVVFGGILGRGEGRVWRLEG